MSKVTPNSNDNLCSDFYKNNPTNYSDDVKKQFDCDMEKINTKPASASSDILFDTNKEEHRMYYSEPQDCDVNPCIKETVYKVKEERYEPVGFSPLALGKRGAIAGGFEAIANIDKYYKFEDTVEYVKYEKRIIEELFITDTHNGNWSGPFRKPIWIDHPEKETSREIIDSKLLGTVDQSRVPYNARKEDE